MHTQASIERWADNWKGLDTKYIQDMSYAVDCSNCGDEFDERDIEAVLLENVAHYFCCQACYTQYKECN